ncbi:MAG: hypothetical protein WD294_01575, partial [Phycisphaeraceae bacterium]
PGGYQFGAEVGPVYMPITKRVNGNFQRLEWSADGERLLLADRIALYVWDPTADELLFHHRELDTRLPAPMIADSDSGLERPVESRSGDGRVDWWSRFAHVAYIADARFTPEGRHIICTYSPEQVSVEANPEASRVRLYSAADGELIEDQMLPAPPRLTAVTPDEQTLLIVCRADDASSAEVSAFNIDGLRHRYSHRFKLHHYFPAYIAPDNAGRFVVFAAGGTWMVDLREDYPPTRLPINGRARMVATFDDGRRVLQADADGTVTMLERQAALMRYGAWSRPATWLVYAVGIGGVTGLIILAGLRRARLDNNRLPPALWLPGIVISIGLGHSVSAMLVEWAIEPVFTPTSDQEGAPLVGLAITTFLIIALFGTMNLRWGWWLITLIVQWLGLMGNVILLLVLGHLTRTDRLQPPSLDSPLSSEGYRLTLHGVSIQNPLWAVFVVLGTSVLIFAIVLRLLYHPTLRTRLQPTSERAFRRRRPLNADPRLVE